VAILPIHQEGLKLMSPTGYRVVLPGIPALRRVEAMEERCKHDMLPRHCGFCQVSSPEPAEHVNGQELVAWLGRLTRPPESGLPTQRRTARVPSPGRAQVPRPIRPFPGGDSETILPAAFRGPELLAPG